MVPAGGVIDRDAAARIVVGRAPTKAPRVSVQGGRKLRPPRPKVNEKIARVVAATPVAANGRNVPLAKRSLRALSAPTNRNLYLKGTKGDLQTICSIVWKAKTPPVSRVRDAKR